MGSRRYCRACPGWVIPKDVQAPYGRGEGQARQAKTQRERDAEERELAVRRGAVKREIARLLEDERLAPESRDILEWYADKVGEAQTMARLDDLIEQAKGENIRREHWWHGRPAAIEAEGYDDDEDQAADDYRLAIEAAPAAAIDHAAELAARGYSVNPDAEPGQCQLLRYGQPCWGGTADGGIYAGQRICRPMLDALNTPLPAGRRRTG